MLNRLFQLDANGTSVSRELVAGLTTFAAMAFDFTYLQAHFVEVLLILLALLFVDLFDTTGTLIGVAERAGLLDQDGRLPRLNQALLTDSMATVAGACLGTSNVTCYVESAAGVEEGGRTG